MFQFPTKKHYKCILQLLQAHTLYVLFAEEHPHSYRGCSSTAIEKAYNAVNSGDMSIRKAAEEYGIPRTTLHNKASGEVNKVVKSGP